MSKSLGNQYTLADLISRGISVRSVRYLFLSVHYRHQLNFTFDSVEGADAALRRFDEMMLRLDRVEAHPGAEPVTESLRRFEQDFSAALADDLNTSGALGAVFALVRDVKRNQKRRTGGALPENPMPRKCATACRPTAPDAGLTWNPRPPLQTKARS